MNAYKNSSRYSYNKQNKIYIFRQNNKINLFPRKMDYVFPWTETINN